MKSVSSHEEVRQAVEAISASGQLSPECDRLLKYLAGKDPEIPAKAADIARDLWPSKKIDDQATTRLRVIASRLRQSLRSYYAFHGQHLDVNIALSEGAYKLVLTRASADAVTRIWRPYASAQKTLVMVAESLFFRTPNRVYVRDLDVNDPAAPSNTVRDLVKDDQLTPTYHYLASGPVLGALRIIQELNSRSIRAEFCTSRGSLGISATDPARESNLVLLGNPRSNSLIRMFEADQDLKVSDDGISTQGKSRRIYRDSHDAAAGKQTGYVLVTRRANLSTARTAATVIAANYSQMVQFVAEALFDAKIAEAILHQFDAGASVLPDQFQLVFEVTLATGYGETSCHGVSLVETRTGKTFASQSPKPFDVVLIHGNKDRREAADLATRLRKRGLTAWCDFEQLRPGQSWKSALESLRTIPVAVLIGSSPGPWQRKEIGTFISHAIESGGTIIPVLLNRRADHPLPSMLEHLEAVDLHDDTEDAYDRLIWGITGKNPSHPR